MGDEAQATARQAHKHAAATGRRKLLDSGSSRAKPAVLSLPPGSLAEPLPAGPAGQLTRMACRRSACGASGSITLSLHTNGCWAGETGSQMGAERARCTTQHKSSGKPRSWMGTGHFKLSRCATLAACRLRPTIELIGD